MKRFATIVWLRLVEVAGGYIDDVTSMYTDSSDNLNMFYQSLIYNVLTIPIGSMVTDNHKLIKSVYYYIFSKLLFSYQMLRQCTKIDPYKLSVCAQREL